MSAKYSNKAIFNALLSNSVSGTCVGCVFQKNGIIRTNKSYVTKRDAKKVARLKNSI